MFVTKKHLSRRTVLRGMGATIALPLLDAMIPARTALAHTAAGATPKLAFVYFPHGAIMSQWTPAEVGKNFELPPLLEPLAPFKDQLTIVSGLENKHAAGPTHAITPGTWLSGTQPRISHDPYGGVTADQIAAQHIGQDTPLPSLEVATEEAVGGGACDRNYGCSYGATISFRTPSTPLPMEFNPRKLFQRLFGQGDTPEEREVLAAQYASILDVVADKAVGAAEGRRPPRPADARRLPRERARDRAARAEDGGERSLAHRVARCARRHSVELRRANELDVRHGRARLEGEPHAHHVVHDGGRGQQHDLQPRRGRRRVPCVVASPEQRREARALAARADVSQARVRALRAEAQGHARRRRLDARPLAASSTAAT